MIKEIYTRSPEDPNYVYGVYETEDAIEQIITKIKMILGTRQGQVLGDVNFGVSIEDLVFQTRINKFDLEEKIRKQVFQYIPESSKYKIDPKVSFGKAEGYDYCIIDFFINDEKAIGVLIK
ncbi:MAG TPA: hypothetical protein PK122_00335 [Candidatus Paceibacterota bacterium]|nr:hypothetical protein [Candidatus Paceibacterota bacterium]